MALLIGQTKRTPIASPGVQVTKEWLHATCLHQNMDHQNGFYDKFFQDNNN